MLGSECDFKMYVRNPGYTLPLQIGGPKATLFSDLQLNRNFNGPYLRNET